MSSLTTDSIREAVAAARAVDDPSFYTGLYRNVVAALADRVDRVLAAEKRWDFEKWNDSGPDKHTAAAELADAMADLRRAVTP